MKEQEMCFCVVRGTFDDNLMLFWKKCYYPKCSLLYGISLSEVLTFYHCYGQGKLQ